LTCYRLYIYIYRDDGPAWPKGRRKINITLPFDSIAFFPFLYLRFGMYMNGTLNDASINRLIFKKNGERNKLWTPKIHGTC